MFDEKAREELRPAVRISQVVIGALVMGVIAMGIVFLFAKFPTTARVQGWMETQLQTIEMHRDLGN